MEEAISPVVAAASVTSLAEAVRTANAHPYGLQTGVSCQDLDVAFGVARRLQMAEWTINDTSSTHPDRQPYGAPAAATAGRVASTSLGEQSATVASPAQPSPRR